MNKNIDMQTERLLIRPLKVADVTPAYICGLNDPEVNRYLFDARFTKQTSTSVVEFVEKNEKSSGDILFGLFVKDVQALIGTIRVSKISDIHFSSSLGICIFEKKWWGRGIGAEAANAVVEYLFKTLGLHYVEAGAYIENKVSIAMFQKIGFTVQAEFREKFRFENNFMPVVFLGKTNENFIFGIS